MEKWCTKCAPKASPRPLLILLNNPKQPLHPKILLKKDYQKALKKLTLFFLSIPVPFNGENYQK